MTWRTGGTMQSILSIAGFAMQTLLKSLKIDVSDLVKAAMVAGPVVFTLACGIWYSAAWVSTVNQSIKILGDAQVEQSRQAADRDSEMGARLNRIEIEMDSILDRQTGK